MPSRRGKGRGKRTKPETETVPEADVMQNLAEKHPLPATQDDPAEDTSTEQQDAGDDPADNETQPKGTRCHIWSQQ